MGWPAPSVPIPKARRARAGAPAIATALVVAFFTTVGSLLVAGNHAVTHQFAPTDRAGNVIDVPVPGQAAATVNFLVQLALLVALVVASVVRPRFAWVRSLAVQGVVLATSVAIFIACYQWAASSEPVDLGSSDPSIRGSTTFLPQ
jgi:hypothetical protein